MSAETRIAKQAYRLGVLPEGMQSIMGAYKAGAFQAGKGQDAEIRGFIEGQRTNNPQWFGAKPDDKSNPFSKEGFHLGRQAEIFKLSPKLAESLARKAGTTIGVRPR
jgi:hypothetical protein